MEQHRRGGGQRDSTGHEFAAAGAGMVGHGRWLLSDAIMPDFGGCAKFGRQPFRRSARSLWNRTSSPSASHFASAAIAPKRSINGSISLL